MIMLATGMFMIVMTIMLRICVVMFVVIGVGVTVFRAQIFGVCLALMRRRRL